MKTEDARTLVFEMVKTIPRGSVMAYGEIGRMVGCTGRQVGRIMATLDGPLPLEPLPLIGEIPWWRVVAYDGALPIAKRNSVLEIEQREKLEGEGIPFDERGRVNMRLLRAHEMF